MSAEEDGEVRFMLNGQRRQHRLAGHERAIDVLAGLGAGGTAASCDSGGCGRCTVLLDGRDVPACLVPAAQLDGKVLIGRDGFRSAFGVLSRVQRGFLRQGATGCGTCLQAMLAVATRLLAHRRAPTAEERREALSAVLCPCGNYGRALAAMADVQDLALPAPPPCGSAVGAAVPRGDGLALMLGEAAPAPPLPPVAPEAIASAARFGRDGWAAARRDAAAPLLRCLAALQADWHAMRAALAQPREGERRGLGLAVAPMSGAVPASASVAWSADGGAVLELEGPEAATEAAQVAADALGLPFARIAVRAGKGRGGGATLQAVAEAAALLRAGAGSRAAATVAAAPAVAVHAALVAFDPGLGTLRVERLAAAHDIGKVVNPLLARAAVEGGIGRGLARVLYGTAEISALDWPEVAVHLLEEAGRPALGLGDGPAIAAGAAVLAAAEDAAGVPAEPPLLPAFRRAAARG